MSKKLKKCIFFWIWVIIIVILVYFLAYVISLISHRINSILLNLLMNISGGVLAAASYEFLKVLFEENSKAKKP